MARLLNFSTHLIILLLFMVGNNLRSFRSAIVEHLPGYSGPLPFTLETGYIGVGEKEEVQLFYYFIESENNPENDPLMVWFTGGPGCSALSGILYEIGPFTIDYANSNASIPTLVPNKYSWTKLANMIFVDQPAGTGFSYANTSEGYYISDTLAASYSYDFLRKWLMNHPKYLQNPLYICGDSYAGYIVPLLIDLVYNGIELGSVPTINFKGYTLGNPGTDANIDGNGKYIYAHQMGLLSNGLYKSAKETCHGNYVNVDPNNILCLNALERISLCLENIRTDMILDPHCLKDSNRVESRHLLSSKELLKSSIQSTAASRKSWCRSDNYVFSSTWANNKIVQQALHVREGTILEWTRCNDTIQNQGAYIKDVPSTISYHKKFSRKLCRALIYSGDHDLIITHTATEEWIESLNLPVQSDWRPWYVEGQVAGYTMTYKYFAYELTYATVKGAGHTAPEYKPMECFAMMRNWLGQGRLPSYSQENDGPISSVIPR